MTGANFDNDLKYSEVQAERLDRYFEANGWKVNKVSLSTDKRGIDRTMTKGDQSITVEYKSDRSPSTNAFVELFSVGDMWSQKGWVWTCQAEWFVYHKNATDTVYLSRTEDIREAVHRWANSNRFNIRSTWNDAGYFTFGLCIPLPVYGCHAKTKTKLEG